MEEPILEKIDISNFNDDEKLALMIRNSLDYTFYLCEHLEKKDFMAVSTYLYRFKEMAEMMALLALTAQETEFNFIKTQFQNLLANFIAMNEGVLKDTLAENKKEIN